MLSVVFTCLIFTLLKEIERFKLDVFQTILSNYIVASIVGYLIMPPAVAISAYPEQDWFLGTLMLSFLFVITFNVMAFTSHKLGISVMTISAKMSMMIPIVIAIVLYGEDLGVVKVFGIILTLAGVVFTVYKKQEKQFNSKLWLLPLVVFINAGTADSILNYIQRQFLADNEMGMLTTVIFFFCFAIAALYFVFQLLVKKMRFHYKSWIGGLVLGVPNYFSIYFILKALSSKAMETSLIFTINNLLIVLISALIGVFLYKEKLSKLNYIGLALSSMAILFFYFAL